MKDKTQIHIDKETRRHTRLRHELTKAMGDSTQSHHTNTTDTQQTLNYLAGEIKWHIKAIHKFNSFMAWFL